MGGDIDARIIRILTSGNTYEERLNAVSSLVEKLRREGETKEHILKILQELGENAPDEQYDILLDVSDFLVGWCSPHKRIE
jgi:hypothetical protein